MKTINKINSYIISILYSFLLHGIVLRDKKTSIFKPKAKFPRNNKYIKSINN